MCLGFVLVPGREVARMISGNTRTALGRPGWPGEPGRCPWVFPADLLLGAFLFAVHPSLCLHSFPFSLSPACTRPAYDV